LAAAAIAVAPVPVAAQSDFFKGRTVTYVVATAPGGGYDAYGRLIAKYMERELGAKIVISNVPGAGHIVGANQVYNARPDGLTIGTFNTGLIYSQILKLEGVRFDLRKMSWIGKAASDGRALVVGKDSGIKGIADLRATKDPVKIAVAGVGSASYNDVRILTEALGLSVRMIPGHNGTEGEMAVMRGEVAGTFGSEGSLVNFVRNGFGVYALSIGKPLPSVPQAMDLAVNERSKGLIALIESQATIGRLTAGPPGIPADRLALLRDAYRRALENPALQEEAKKLDMPIEPAYGDDVAKLIDGALNQSPDSVKLIASIMNVKVDTVTVRTNVLKVEDKGRVIEFKSGDDLIAAKPSGSRTKIKVGGKDADRGALKEGMVCTITFTPGPDNEPSTMDCG
jgi:tripartite-type tricarboxylate transporter receptor subunit TctC